MGSERDRTVGTTLVILGASGDLSARLLLPGLGALVAAGGARGLKLVGSDVEDWDDDRWRARVAESFMGVEAIGQEPAAVIAETRYVRCDATDEAALRALVADADGDGDGRLVLYFALPPEITAAACRALATIGVPDGTRLALEKPFGADAASATALNDLLTGMVPEDHVHRIDHFLGMSTVLNLLGTRLANRMIEPVLNNQHVDSVDVVFDETLALEGRAAYYDSAGAMVDMIQSHMLEVMALFAMDPPPTLAARDVRDGKAQVLRATRVWDDDPTTYSRRARYTAGTVDGREVPSYVDEEGVDGSRGTETFAELVLAVDTWRWAGVPLRVRSGKALSSPRTEVTVTFKAPPRVPTGMTGPVEPGRLHLGISLDTNALAVDLNITGAGDPFAIDQVTLDGRFGTGRLPPYGEVLKGIVDGDPPLSVRGDMAVESWRIIEPVQEAWRAGKVPLQEYEAGSTDPGGWPLTGLPGGR